MKKRAVLGVVIVGAVLLILAIKGCNTSEGDGITIDSIEPNVFLWNESNVIGITGSNLDLVTGGFLVQGASEANEKVLKILSDTSMTITFNALETVSGSWDLILNGGEEDSVAEKDAITLQEYEIIAEPLAVQITWDAGDANYGVDFSAGVYDLRSGRRERRCLFRSI